MTKIAFIIVIVVALVFLAPLALIWSLNTLFPLLAIPYTFWTWLAMFVLSSVLTNSGLKFKA
jgi:hypothetical protein